MGLLRDVRFFDAGSDGEHGATVDAEHDAGDIARPLAGQETGDIAEFLDPAVAADRDRLGHLLGHFLGGQALAHRLGRIKGIDARGSDSARRDDITGDSGG